MASEPSLLENLWFKRHEQRFFLLLNRRKEECVIESQFPISIMGIIRIINKKSFLFRVDVCVTLGNITS